MRQKLVNNLEKLRITKFNKSFPENDYNTGYKEGVNKTLNDVKSMLEELELFGAPKKVKLSGIVKRLNSLASVTFVYNDTSIGYFDCDELDDTKTIPSFVKVISFNETMQICNIDEEFNDFTKWLFVYMVAGVLVDVDVVLNEENNE